MTSFIIRRLIQALFILILVTLIVFFVMRLLPGDPILLYISQSGDLQSMPPEQIDVLRAKFGLDKPIMEQYVNWVKNITRLDFGISIYWHIPVSELLKERIPVTLYLGVIAMIIGTVFGLLAGIISAIRRGSWIDKTVLPLTYLGICIPIFWLGILMIYFFGLQLRWLPLAGFTWPTDNFVLSLKQIIMPVICLSVFSLAANARQMRSSMLEVVRQDYIRTAWSKGLKERSVILRHAMKNSLIPVVTLMGIGLGHVFGGSVLVEQVFAIPGMGRLAVQAIFGQDYIVVQAVTFVTAVTILLANLLVDISYGFLDPRIRYS
ncbi:MAG: ABC transporter permease [Sedimentisphaerales bacterium]|nr:ABC transporter permease [Sedimentisphaerales bacterium]